MYPVHGIIFTLNLQKLIKKVKISLDSIRVKNTSSLPPFAKKRITPFCVFFQDKFKNINLFCRI